VLGSKLLIEYAMCFIGLPYRWGGDDTIDGFDCSGLVQEILSAVGMDPPGDQTALGLFKHFLQNNVGSIEEPGALAFYGPNINQITHIGFLVDKSLMIEAGGGGSKTTSLAAAAAQNAYVRLRPVRFRKDLVAILMPRYPWYQ
jgi:cell wall-associated NlpC family hydrolase